MQEFVCVASAPPELIMNEWSICTNLWSPYHIVLSYTVPGRYAIPVAQFPDYVKQMQQERDNKLEAEYEVSSSLPFCSPLHTTYHVDIYRH